MTKSRPELVIRCLSAQTWYIAITYRLGCAVEKEEEEKKQVKVHGKYMENDRKFVITASILDELLIYFVSSFNTVDEDPIVP